MSNLNFEGMAIAEGVVETIVTIAVQDVEGVASLSNAHANGILGAFGKKATSGSVEVVVNEDDTFSVNLKQHSLQEAWESESFAKFREKQTKVCANCTTGICRSCGLELGLNLCGNIKGNLQ